MNSLSIYLRRSSVLSCIRLRLNSLSLFRISRKAFLHAKKVSSGSAFSIEMHVFYITSTIPVIKWKLLKVTKGSESRFFIFCYILSPYLVIFLLEPNSSYSPDYYPIIPAPPLIKFYFGRKEKGLIGCITLGKRYITLNGPEGILNYPIGPIFMPCCMSMLMGVGGCGLKKFIFCILPMLAPAILPTI